MIAATAAHVVVWVLATSIFATTLAHVARRFPDLRPFVAIASAAVVFAGAVEFFG